MYQEHQGCSERKIDILKVFGIDISNDTDVDTTHPQPYTASNVIQYSSWSAHSVVAGQEKQPYAPAPFGHASSMSTQLLLPPSVSQTLFSNALTHRGQTDDRAGLW